MNNVYPHIISWDGLVVNLGRALEKIYGERKISQSVLDYAERKVEQLDLFIM